MGKKPFYGKFKKSRGEQNDSRDNRECFDERHKGSIPIEEIKASDEYQRKVTLEGTKRKYAICFSYLGTKYQGLQINPDAITVEAILEKALFLAGAIDEFNFGNLQKIQWTRAARTDRGVHAISQCCAMKIHVSNDRTAFIHSLNSFLPNDIRVHTLTRVSKNFNSKLYCGKRRYHYLLPTYLLTDMSVVNRLLNDQYVIQGGLKGAGYSGGYADPNSTKFLEKELLRVVRTQLIELQDSHPIPSQSISSSPSSSPSSTSTPSASSSLPSLPYPYSTSSTTAAPLSLLREALHCFEGTHNFHNYTSGKDASESNATRYIQSFSCSDPFLVPQDFPSSSSTSSSTTSSSTTSSSDTPTRPVEYVLFSVEGQSFLLNQIRRMVSFAVEVARGAASLDQLRTSLTTKKMDLTMVPGLGLYLDELYFDGYNQKQEVGKAKATSGARRKLQKEKEPTTSTPSSSSIPPLPSSPSTTSPSSSLSSSPPPTTIEEEGRGDRDGERVKQEETTKVNDEKEDRKKEQPIERKRKENESIDQGEEREKEGEEERGRKEEGEEEGEGELDIGSYDRLEWHLEPTTLSSMHLFRSSILWPHIFQEECEGLSYLYYLDYLRVSHHSYQVKEDIKGGEGRGGGGGGNYTNKGTSYYGPSPSSSSTTILSSSSVLTSSSASSTTATTAPSSSTSSVTCSSSSSMDI